MASSDDEILAFLSDPATFGVTGPVERIETHISIVFLAGDRAYKLKRAIKLSYLDFSTPERRRQACEAELAVNRRTAPQLYLCVRAICRNAAGALTLDRDGAPVDWLVVMRRFEQNLLLDRMVEAGRVDAGLARKIADAVADLHDAAEMTPAFGGKAGIGSAIAVTEDNLRLHSDRFPAEDIDRWCRAAYDECARLSEQLEERRAAGKVRAGHGDLHLRNICLIDGAPVLFDGIEFDRSIACVDILYDLAFLLMDLLHRNRTDLATIVFNRYLDRRDEADGLATMPLFLSLRAAIRAQIAAARPDDGHGDAPSYLALAVSLLDRPPPRLVAIGGFSGSGKSTLAAALAPSIGPAPGARVLRSDVLRKWLAGRDETARLPAEFYRAESHQAVYAALMTRSAVILAAGHSVIADAVFSDPTERRVIEQVAQDAGADFTGLWLEGPSELLERRVEQRTADASDATVLVVRDQLARGAGTISWRHIDASGTIADNVIAARRSLDLRGPPTTGPTRPD